MSIGRENKQFSHFLKWIPMIPPKVPKVHNYFSTILVLSADEVCLGNVGLVTFKLTGRNMKGKDNLQSLQVFKNSKLH